MKKTLIALAAVASTAAFAQSVTIDGTLDNSYQIKKNAAGVTEKTMVGSSGNQGTTGISFRGSEDLGGGLKAYFRYEANFDASSGTGGLGSDSGELFVGLQGGFGSVQFGKPNTHTLAVQGARTPFGTKLGGGYTRQGTAVTRKADTIKYTSPTFSGITVGFTHQLKDSSGTTPLAAWNEVGAFYAAGPLKVGFSNVNQSGVYSQNNLSASYDLGVATVMGGYVAEDDKKGAANSKRNGYNIAVSVPMGAVTLMANYSDLDVKGGSAKDRKETGIGARYALSKRTSVYARYVTDKTQDKTTNDKYTIVGIQHNF